jgi:hypothetical protein
MTHRLLTAAALLAGCAQEGPRGEQGPPGPVGDTGQPGRAAPALDVYVVQVTEAPPAAAWCADGADLVLGGGCRWSGDVGASADEPVLDEDGFTPVGWTCEGVSAVGDDVTVSVLCASVEP